MAEGRPVAPRGPLSAPCLPLRFRRGGGRGAGGRCGSLEFQVTHSGGGENEATTFFRLSFYYSKSHSMWFSPPFSLACTRVPGEGGRDISEGPGISVCPGLSCAGTWSPTRALLCRVPAGLATSHCVHLGGFLDQVLPRDWRPRDPLPATLTPATAEGGFRGPGCPLPGLPTEPSPLENPPPDSHRARGAGLPSCGAARVC